MGRPVILGNGSLTVGLNEAGLVHDFYYPYVGLDNLTTARSMDHRIGVWVDGTFSWVDDGSWVNSVDFESDALVSKVEMYHEQLGITLTTTDFVDSDFNAFCRQLTVHNLEDHERTIRIFLHQVFEISRAGRADTALYEPDENYILDYKGRCSLLVYGHDQHGHGFDQFSIGNYGVEDKLGTYIDAEDGELSGNPVEHGGVDSVVRFSMKTAGKGTESLDYWVVAADSQFSAEKIHHQILSESLNGRLQETRSWWHHWLGTAREATQSMSQDDRTLINKSLMIIKAHTDKRGGIIASCDSSIYNYGRDYYSYVWPRDGAYAMWPLIRLGYTEEPRKFFEFCRDTLTPEGYMMHKYQPDRAIGSTWHPLLHGKHRELAIQEDETAIVIYMLGEYLTASDDHDFVANLYMTLVQPAANFLADFRDEHTKLPHASYDLWEEKFLTTTYTVATVYQALLTAADFADTFEYPDDAVRWRAAAQEISENIHPLFNSERRAFRKGYLLQEDGTLTFDDTLDVSGMYGMLMFGERNFAEEHTESTVKVIEETLLDKSPSGGLPRYEHDVYFSSHPETLGNPWFVTTLWLAQYYMRADRLADAKRLTDWTIQRAMPSGVLSEQVDPETSQPLSVAPLVWSHAELINTLLDLRHKQTS
ncbi:MAG TPA: glycoside hydrolase family 15 protein [Candidatus Microsaccharimonas sp.]|nr:glycoside hydrolase family 15 protein [Candidatus Microsaccharimonas sp.]